METTKTNKELFSLGACKYLNQDQPVGKTFLITETESGLSEDR